LKYGKCRICGAIGKLSFEHIPPEAAFNNKSVRLLEGIDAITKNINGTKYSRISQKGFGNYTLCERCNNNTGAWYGNDFVNWCYQGMDLLRLTNGNPHLIYIHYLCPLKIIKQIITMFFSINGDRFCENNQELVGFVLNRKRKYLNEKYRVYTYFNYEGGTRSTGIMGKFDINKSNLLIASKPIIMSEFSFRPYGYVLTIDSDIPDRRLFDITYFSNYDYDDFRVMSMDMKALPTHTVYAGDYREMDEIVKQSKENDII